MDQSAAVAMEAGGAPTRKESGRLPRGHVHGHSGLARTAHGMSSSSLRKKSDATLVRKVPVQSLRPVLANLQEVLLGTKLAVLFVAVPLAVAAQCFRFGQVRRDSSIVVCNALSWTDQCPLPLACSSVSEGKRKENTVVIRCQIKITIALRTPACVLNLN